MEILDLDEAAKLLKMNSEVLRRKAKRGEVPGRKAGKCWIFVEMSIWQIGFQAVTHKKTPANK